MASPNGIGLIMRLRPSIEVISGMNECASFFQWTRSVVSSLRSRRSGTHEQDHQNDALHSQSGQSGPQQQDNQDDVLHSPSGHDGSQVQDLPNNAFPMQRGRNGLHEQDHQDDILLHLQSGLQHLRDTLPLMYNLIDRAEWRSHEQVVTNLLPNLKDAVSDADDLLDEFKWYEMKVELEGNASKSPFIDFFDKVIQGSFNKLKNIQGRLDHLSSKMQNIGLWEVAPRFDNIVRPETSSLPNEAKLFGRDKEMKDLMRLLNVPTGSKRKRGTCLVNESTCASSSTQINNESRIPSLSVLPILGIGGVGKTTLAQHICSHKQVKSHFDLIIWICVSDDFDVKRLTKEAIESCSGTEAKVDNLNCLQLALAEHVRNKRFLIVLDDMWDDALKENGQSWRNFVAPLESAKEGSMMLVTTRCPRVAHQVGTMDSITLEGLKDDIFWNFFKLCAFGSEGANNYPELENIGRNILPKLKGSPLAAKTLGRMLRMNLQESHWNSILESELWELTQEVTDILPALRLSYMYLPFYLKQCFSFCAVYPKDYRFEKEDLVEIWVSEGFVEPQGNYPIQKIGNQYFEDLVARSFFQRVRGGYVIHDLLHDMAQKVSEHDCFILRDKDDFDKVPLHVRHIYILPNSDVLHSDLMKLGKHTKLRTLICKKQLLGDNTGSVLEGWCMKLLRIRVISCASTKKLPDSIGNLTHLRYLKIEGGCSLNIPSSFCGLYNMKVFCVKKCKIQSLPSDFSKLINLQRFKSQGFSYYPGCRITLDGADMQGQQIGLIKNLNQFRGHLDIANIDMLSKDQAVEAKLKNKTYLYELMLKWPFRSSPNNNGSEIMQQNGTEVLQALQPPISLRSLLIHRYPGVSLPSWFQPENLPNLTSLDFEFCHVLDNIPFSIGVFQSLTDLNIGQCDNLSSLEHLLHPDYVPAIKKLKVLYCKSLVSVATERFGDLAFLEELDVHGCPNICSQSLVSSSLTRLKLGDCGNLLDNINCCSLTNFSISPKSVTSIQPQMWSLPALEELIFWGCNSLTSIGVPHNFSLCEGTGSVGALSMLKFLIIKYCPELLIFDSLLTKEYLPAIERIHVQDCAELLSLPGERFGGFHSLRELSISGCPRLDWQIGLVLPSPLQTLCLSYCGALSGCVFGCLENPTFLVSLKWLSVLDCPSLNWQKGLVLPSSLQTLKLVRCGDFSACVPGCLENLTSLVSLEMSGCQGVTYIPGSIWRGKLALLEELEIQDCPNLVSVGGASAVAQINKVEISHCPKLKEAEQIMMRGSRRSSRRH